MFLADLQYLKIDQLNSLHKQISMKEKALLMAGTEASRLYQNRNPPRELAQLIQSLKRQFQMAKSNIESACGNIRRDVAKREEAGLRLVSLLTSLQEAELQLADPINPDTDITSAKRTHDKLQVFFQFFNQINGR